MSRSLIAIWAAMFVVWVLVMPIGFVTLYSTIELQGAARSAAKVDERLATLRTVELAHQLDMADAANERLSMLGSIRHKALINLFQARGEARAMAVNLLIAHGMADANGQCTASDADLKACQIDQNLAACQPDWRKITQCYDQAVLESRNTPDDGPAVKALHAKMDEARSQGFAFNRISEQLRDAQARESDTLLPVAEGYRDARLPGIHLFFRLPQGVVVACFTCLMAAIGAGVSSLVNFLRGGDDGQTPHELIRSFMISPLLGGLTGFMVYFVVSAGTSFLVQPAPADPAQMATSNLSAPALAALGVMAGLAAEKAIFWLQANTFFQG